MKNLLLILLVALCVPVMAWASVREHSISRRAVFLQKYAPAKTTASTFLDAVRAGDVAIISQLTDASLLSAQDKFGNNVFHLAKDVATLKALEDAAGKLTNKSLSLIYTLRNQRNHMGETPLMVHINYGKSDTFEQLLEGTDLLAAMQAANSVDKGGALGQTAHIKKEIARALSKDYSGRTVAQAALANVRQPGMAEVVNFFQQKAVYLF